MGVAGLLKSLRSITKRVHIREYCGLKAAIDLHCWIHKGSIGCCRELSEGIETSKYVDYCIDMLKLLVVHGITPIVVFDGRALPAKHLINTSRRNSRHENAKKARQAEADGRFSDAHSFFQKTTTVTADMVHQVIRALKKHNIQFIVSPYEADAQLAFLSLTGAADIVITEDSDALVYGCRKVLFKLDKDGSGDEIKRRSLGANQGLSFLNWTDDQFKLMCCLAGCDYVKKIRNIGIVTAHKYVHKHKTFTKTTDALLVSKYDGIDEEYVMQLRRAMNTFKHQTVFNPDTASLQPLTPIRNCLTLNYDPRFFNRRAAEDAECDYLGPHWEQDLAIGVVSGVLHPYTLLPFEDERQQQQQNQNLPPNPQKKNNEKQMSGPCPAQLGEMRCTRRSEEQAVLCERDKAEEAAEKREKTVLHHDWQQAGERIYSCLSPLEEVSTSYSDEDQGGCEEVAVSRRHDGRRNPYEGPFNSPQAVQGQTQVVSRSMPQRQTESRSRSGRHLSPEEDLWKFNFKASPVSSPLVHTPKSHKGESEEHANNSIAASSSRSTCKKRKRQRGGEGKAGADFVPLRVNMLHRRHRHRTPTPVVQTIHGEGGGDNRKAVFEQSSESPLTSVIPDWASGEGGGCEEDDRCGDESGGVGLVCEPEHGMIRFCPQFSRQMKGQHKEMQNDCDLSSVMAFQRGESYWDAMLSDPLTP